MITLKKFLSYYANESTRRARKSGIIKFLEFVCKIEREDEDMEKHLKKYMSKKRDYHNDLLTFAISMSDTPPLTARSYISAVKEYFLRNDIQFNELQLRDIRNKSPKGRTRTEEDDLTKEVIQQILEYTDVRGRALFLTLISTGMRIGECLQLNIQDIDLKNSVITIKATITKTKEPRYTFLNKEAMNALNAYMQVRGRYMETTFKRGGRVVERKEAYKNRLFPFSDTVALQIFSIALQKAGLESFSSSVRRRTFHIHMFRKYFRSQLAVGCPADMVEALMGHNSYLSNSYRRYNKAQMFEHYQKAEHLLYINEVDINKLESKYEQKLEISKNDQQEQIDQLKEIVGALADKLGIQISLPSGEKIENVKTIKVNPEELEKKGIIKKATIPSP